MKRSLLIILLLFSTPYLFGQDTTQTKLSVDSLVVLQKVAEGWLKDFKRKGVIIDGDTIKKTKEYNKLRKDSTYRQLLYPTTYSWEKAAEFIKSKESNKYVWYLINMYSSSELNKQYVIKSLVSFNENTNVKKILYDSFFSYCFTDPSISTIKRKKPVITHPDILMKKFTIVREMRLKIR